MEYEKLSNQEIVDKMKFLEEKHIEITRDVSEKLDLLDIINSEYQAAESAIKKRLNIK